jgi:cytosine/uracil/thiamine/allantoin permease
MILDLISLTASTIYIFSMIYTFYLLIVADSKETLRKAQEVAKVAIVTASISLFCHMLSLEGWQALMDLIRIAGPMSLLWSTNLRIKAMPMTEAERFEAEALRDLHKL